ncbi:hypothetical protein Tco_0380925, partial [Tanacetum coccineum]
GGMNDLEDDGDCGGRDPLVLLRGFIEDSSVVDSLVCLQVVEAAREVLLENFSSYEVHTYGPLGYLFANKQICTYNFNAYVSNNSSTAGFTFFTPNADVLTGSDCTQLVKKNDIPSPCEFPTKILSFKGKTHIFLFHYNPSCAKGKVDFFDDILDKLLQIAGPSQVSKDTTGTTESSRYLQCHVKENIAINIVALKLFQETASTQIEN